MIITEKDLPDNNSELSTRAEAFDETLAAARADEGEEAASELSTKQRRRGLMWVQAAAFVIGFSLLIYLVRRVGVQVIFDALKQIGFGYFLILTITGARHLMRTLAMRQSIPREFRTFSFRQAFGARLAGEAVTFLTFAGPLLGEATKAALLKRRVPLARGVQAIVVDNLIYNLSVAFVIFGGALAMLLTYPLPRVVRYVVIGIAASAGICLVLVSVAARKRVMPLTWTLDRVAALGVRGVFPFRVASQMILGKRDGISQLEMHVNSFYRARRNSFFLMFAFNFLAHATSVLEVYTVLMMLGYHASVTSSFIIESLTKVINFAFGFVPATIGVYEGGTAFILQSLGYATAVGFTLAVVRKSSIVFWTSIGLLVLSAHVIPSLGGKLINRHPRLQKSMDNLVISNIAHRPARTLATIFGIGIGVLLIVFTVGLANGVLRAQGEREANIGAEILLRPSGTIGIGTSSSGALALDENLARQLARIEGVKAATPLAQTTINTDSGFGFRLVDGIRFDEYRAIANLQIIHGRGLNATGDEVIVDTQWVQERKTATTIGSTISLFERPFTVVGIYNPPGGGRVKIPLSTLQEQLGGNGRASSILVSCLNPAEQERVAARIAKSFPDSQILFTRDLPELYAQGTPALRVFLNVITVVAATISTLVVLLAMYTTIIERTRQIGILKALGMSPARIAWVIEQEALLISFLGVIAGLILVLLARFVVMRMTTLNVEISVRWLLISLAIGVAGGTIGALYPAIKAARQDPIKALSYE